MISFDGLVARSLFESRRCVRPS